MRRIVLAALLGAATLAAPAAASASSYTFDVPAGGGGDGWSGQLSPGFVGCAGALATWCPAPGALHAHAATGAPLAAWSAASLVLTSPSSTEIARVDLHLRYRTADAAVHPRVETSTALAGGTWAVTLLPDSAGGTSRTVHLAVPGMRRVAAALATDSAVPAGRTGAAAENALDVTGARVTLVDPVAPHVAVTAPRAGVWYRGRVCLPASATDLGLGVFGIHLDAGGRTVDALAPASASRLVPRPGAFAASLCLDTTPFGDGAVSGVVTSSDGAAPGGNASAPATFGMLVDNHAPDLSATVPAAGESRAPAVSVAARDGASGVAAVTATVDGAALALAPDGAGGWRGVPAALAYGRHLLRVTATDAAGNAAAVERTLDVVDVTPPRIGGLVPAGGAVAAPTAAIGFTALDEGSGVRADSVRVSLDGADVDASGTLDAGGTFRLQPRQPLAPGAHVVRVLLADVAGNAAGATWRFSVAAPLALRFDRARLDIPAGRRTVVRVVVTRGGTPAARAVVRLAWAGGGAGGTAVADASGVARVALDGRRAGVLVASVSGASARLRVVLRASLVLRASAASGTVRVSGRLLPAGVRGVVVEAYASGRWVGVRALHVAADGRFTARLRLRRGHLYILRASTGSTRSRAVQVWVR